MIYKNLDAWKEARALVKFIYEHTSQFPQAELFGLQSQIRRASISIPSNIAEGCGRNHRKEALHFFYIARGSAYELETQIYLANDLNYMSHDGTSLLLKQLEQVRKLLSGLINFYKSQIEKNSEHPSLHTDH